MLKFWPLTIFLYQTTKMWNGSLYKTQWDKVNDFDTPVEPVVGWQECHINPKK